MYNSPRTASRPGTSGCMVYNAGWPCTPWHRQHSRRGGEGGEKKKRRRRRKTTLTCLSLSALDNHTHTHTYPPRNLNPLKRRQQARESWRHALQVQHRYNPRSNSYFKIIFSFGLSLPNRSSYKDLSPVFFSLWLLSYRAPAGGFHTTLACR